MSRDRRAGDTGKSQLYKFKDVPPQTPAIAVTSRLLTTGVDIPTCKNIVLVRVIRSMTDFKQIVGRGTRVDEDNGKLFFNILDYTHSTRLFADPEFDGEPDLIKIEAMNDEGQTVEGSQQVIEPQQPKRTKLNPLKALPLVALLVCLMMTRYHPANITLMGVSAKSSAK